MIEHLKIEFMSALGKRERNGQSMKGRARNASEETVCHVTKKRDEEIFGVWCACDINLSPVFPTNFSVESECVGFLSETIKMC